MVYLETLRAELFLLAKSPQPFTEWPEGNHFIFLDNASPIRSATPPPFFDVKSAMVQSEHLSGQKQNDGSGWGNYPILFVGKTLQK